MKIGWIGCGTHALEMLLPQLTRHDVRIAALCDTNAVNLAKAANQYGVTDAYSRAEDLLAHPGLDAIGMAVGPKVHLEAGIAAMQRGLPVFMEKPPGSNHAEAEALLRASDKAAKPIVLGFMKRYSVGNKIAANIIHKGDFGDVHSFVGSYMTAPGYFQGDYTSFLLHHCVHYLDLPAFLVSPIREVTVRKRETEPGRLLLNVSVGFDNGALGTIVMGTIQSRGTPMEFIQLMGTDRRLVIDNIINVTYWRHAPFKAADAEATLTNDQDGLTWSPNFTAAANEDFKGYHALMEATLRTFAGENVGAPTMSAGVEAMRHLDTVRAAVEA